MLKIFAAGLTAIVMSGSATAHAQTSPAAAAPSAPATPAARLNLDTPIEQIAADPKGKAVLVADMPKLMNGPAYDMVKTMSLRQLQPMSQGRVTQAVLDKVEADLKVIP